MKKILVSLFFLFSALHAEEAPPEPQIDMEQLSETLGHLLVRHLVSSSGINFSFEKIVQGMHDERDNKPSPLTEEQYQQMVALIQERLFDEMAAQNLSAANAFLESNKSRPEMVVFDEKLHYEILAKGEGEVVTAESTPLIHYEGKLLDGTIFASSRDGMEPIALPIQQTIEGFSKGLAGMQEGEKRRLYIHPDFAYGVEGHLPPNSLLIFEIEIVKANSPQQEEPS